jgi:beta-N-acetylhexosaminidase
MAAGVIVTGFDGTQLDRSLDLAGFAGCILFSRNTPDVARTRALTDAIRARFDRTPIIAIDQEGGRIMRLREGVEPIPPMMAIGATGDAQLARDAGEQLGFDLRRAGCNLDFAPVIDVAVNEKNTVIGTRAFGASPSLVTAMGRAFAEGLERAGIVPVFKHFPGHGSTALDTHLGPARLDIAWELLERRDLVPFAAVARSAPAIMAAHVCVPDVDGDTPASMSHDLLTGVLRRSWKFDGVIFTDCMQMDAIALNPGTVEGVVRAIGAGADCALVSHDAELARAAARALADRVASGALERSRLAEAYARVTRMRERLTQPLPLGASSPHPGIGARIAREALRVVSGTLPVAPGTPVAYSHRAHVDPSERARVDAALAADPRTVVVSTAEPYDLALFPRASVRIAAYGDDPVTLAAVNDALYAG